MIATKPGRAPESLCATSMAAAVWPAMCCGLAGDVKGAVGLGDGRSVVAQAADHVGGGLVIGPGLRYDGHDEQALGGLGDRLGDGRHVGVLGQ
ncbi:hypothetical protein ACFV2U_41275 [Streptomyces sp. NPDC059697]|uniref:hypothetical protein n=1 Tax=Streptomyces sp. NPDC059697 TaxID=3346912 RepID=UPI0036A14700